jgi:hypothetical protein
MSTKEEIVEEIKRTADKDGLALGSKNFRNETDIGPWEWGKYWPTWGAAVKEAGLTQRSRWEKYPEGILEKDAIYLIRKLGKYFTKGEMRVEYVSNPDFHYSAIDKKRKNEFVNDVIAYCKKHPGHDDILKTCVPILKELEAKAEEVTDNSSTAGEVYLYKVDSHYKIGKSKDSLRRGAELRLQTPSDPVMIHTIKTDDPTGVELYWDNRFKEKRMKGEWFKLNRDDVKAFKRWRRIY